MLCTDIVSDIKNNYCTQHVLPRASDKDLPVPNPIFSNLRYTALTNASVVSIIRHSSSTLKKLDLSYTCAAKNFIGSHNDCIHLPDLFQLKSMKNLTNLDFDTKCSELESVITRPRHDR